MDASTNFYQYMNRRHNWIDSFHMACMILIGIGPAADRHLTNLSCFHYSMHLYNGVAFPHDRRECRVVARSVAHSCLSYCQASD